MNQSATRLFTGMLMLATIMLVWNQVATAAMLTLSRPIEIATADVPLWQMRAGILSIRACDDCSLQLLRVDDKTEFDVSGDQPDPTLQPADRRERFLEKAREPEGRNGMITLFLDKESDYVRRMRLSPRPRS